MSSVVVCVLCGVSIGSGCATEIAESDAANGVQGLSLATAGAGVSDASDREATISNNAARWTARDAVSLEAQAAANAGPYNIAFSDSDKCADVFGASNANLQPIVQYSCIFKSSQRWTFEWTQDGYARIRNSQSGLCLNVRGASLANGAEIIQYPCGNFANEQWKGEYYATRTDNWLDYYWLRPKHANDSGLNKCLVVQNASQADNARLILWDCADNGVDNDLATWF